MNSIGKYAKTIVGIAGVVTTALETQIPNQHWVVIANAVVTAVLVYLVPNQP